MVIKMPDNERDESGSSPFFTGGMKQIDNLVNSVVSAQEKDDSGPDTKPMETASTAPVEKAPPSYGFSSIFQELQ